jgi:short-subunit dehydrogenase
MNALHNLLKNRIFIVTGASSGIGRCITNDLSQFPIKSLILVARDQSRLDKCSEEVRKKDVEVITMSCDVSNKGEVKHLGDKILERYGYIDYLINNAGIGTFNSVEKISIEEIEKINYTNYFGMIYFTKVFLDCMIERNSGHIINIASLAASFGIPGMAAYCGSKFAMLGFSESLNQELKKTRIKVSVINPIGVKTNFFNNESFNYKIPMKYVLKPEQVSKAVLKSFVSGSFQVYVPKIAGLALPFKFFFPSIVNFVIERHFRKLQN